MCDLLAFEDKSLVNVLISSFVALVSNLLVNSSVLVPNDFILSSYADNLISCFSIFALIACSFSVIAFVI